MTLVEPFLSARVYVLRLFRSLRKYPVKGLAYRSFCRRVIGEMDVRITRQARSMPHQPDAGSTGSFIKRFRKHVHASELGGIFQRTDDPENVARSLRIPELIPLFPSAAFKCSFWLLTRWMSDRDKLLAASTILSKIGTSEGKDHVFCALLYILCGNHGKHSYWSMQLEFLLAEFRGYDSSTQLHALAAIPFPLLVAGKRMGIICPAKLLDELRPLQTGINPVAVRTLVDEGVLTAGFAVVRPFVKEDSYRHFDDSLNEAPFRETIRILTRKGVSSENLLAILQQTWQLSPSKLMLTTQLLDKHGITDLNTLYANLGEQLWTLNLDVLRFLVADVGICDPEVLAKLGQVLRERRPPALSVINEVLTHTGQFSSLTQVQTLLVASHSCSAPAAQRLGLLLSEPYSLTLQELNNCAPYLTSDVENDAKFMAFLGVLQRHRLGHSRGALLFQKCFVVARSAALIDQLIELTRRQLPEISDESLAEFVEQTLSLRTASVLYLLGESNVKMKDVGELDKLVRLGSVSTDVLRYLVNDRRLNTVALLGRWFYDEGEGVQIYSGMGTYGDLERELFTDCSRRKAFFRLQQNAQAVVDAIWAYADSRVPKLSSESTDEERSARSSSHEQFRKDAEKMARPFVRTILQRTDGIILAGTLGAALMGEDLNETLRALEATLRDLLIGRGPAGATISSMEAEAIGLVHGVTKHQVLAHWGKIIGCQHHLARICLDSRYPMTWSKMRYSLPDFKDAQLEALVSNFSALSRAASRARELNKPTEFADQVNQFRVKPFGDNAAEPPELADWLGLIVAISGGDPTVRLWIDTTLDSYADFFDRPQDAHKRTLALQTFLSTTLPDEFQARVVKFVDDLADVEVARLSARLKFLVPSRSDDSQRNLLVESLRVVCDKVLDVFSSCVLTLQQKFLAGKKHLPDAIKVSGFVTKYPAAFFCRFKFGLCTRENTEMWREERHSHFVVFDDATRTLIGMAMIYVQCIPDHFAGQDCIVIRAINLRSPDSIQIDPKSAIDEIMRVAITIAKQNKFAAVLFPKSSTYFSNQPYVEKALSEASTTAHARGISLHRSPWSASQEGRGLFWCKEWGRKDGAVSELFCVWTAVSPADRKN